MRSRRPARRERAPLRLQRRPRRDLLDARSPRSSRAGSIAASRWARADHPGPAVAPLVESGLHCGGTDIARSWLARRVAPLVESGLHCGHRGGSHVVRAAGRRPARRERAPLRPSLGGVAPILPVLSPRSSRAGSIAAPPWPNPTTGSNWSPRSSRAGSIAAAHRRTGPVEVVARRPARRERAPLRRSFLAGW